MKLHELIRQVYYEPSIITPGAHASIRRLLESRFNLLGGGHENLRDPGKDMCGATVAVEQMAIRKGIAYIPVGGVIGKNLNPFDRGAGAVDVNDLTQELDQAKAADEVRGAIMLFDSPGGMVSGTPETARRIQEFSKPIYAYTENQMASAAYWLGSACDGVFCTETADVGSIGVYIPWIDQTKAYEEEGLKVELIKAGRLKGLGFPGTALTEEQRAHLQSRVDEIYSMFTGHVKAQRPKVTSESMQGQTFMGGQAFARGLVDAVVRDIGEVEALIR